MDAGSADLLAFLDQERQHVLDAVAGLGEADLTRALVPSGWTIAGMLSHLAIDDELFWIGAVLGADPDAINDVQDGWRTGLAGAEAIERYRAEVERSNRILAVADLTARPLWRPPPEVFDAPTFSTGEEVVLRVLTETATHAGHLDIVRELIDGHQHLVLD